MTKVPRNSCASPRRNATRILLPANTRMVAGSNPVSSIRIGIAPSGIVAIDMGALAGFRQRRKGGKHFALAHRRENAHG